MLPKPPFPYKSGTGKRTCGNFPFQSPETLIFKTYTHGNARRCFNNERTMLSGFQSKLPEHTVIYHGSFEPHGTMNLPTEFEFIYDLILESRGYQVRNFVISP